MNDPQEFSTVTKDFGCFNFWLPLKGASFAGIADQLLFENPVPLEESQAGLPPDSLLKSRALVFSWPVAHSQLQQFPPCSTPNLQESMSVSQRLVLQSRGTRQSPAFACGISEFSCPENMAVTFNQRTFLSPQWNWDAFCGVPFQCSH